VGLKNWVLYAAKLVAVFKTVIGAKVAPVGTVTVILVVVAAVIVALVAPKNTMLLAGVVLKPVPAIVTTSPGLALNGVKEVMVGAVCANPIWEVKNRLRMKKNLKCLIRLAII